MIGNKAHAQTIADFDFALDEWNDPTRFPEGFKHLGTGAYRIAMLGPDGVVYKRSIEDDTHEMNNAEADMFKAWGDKTEMVSFAPCYLWDCGVLAMEYVESDGTTLAMVTKAALRTLTRNLGLYDALQPRNFMVINEAPVLVDYSM